MKRIGVLVLAAALIITSAPQGAEAKKTVKLNKSRLTMEIGTKKVLKVSGIKKVKWGTSNKAVCSLTAKKKKSVKLNAKKAGKAVVTAKYNLSGKSKKLKCKVTVTDKNVQVSPKPNVTQTPNIAVTPQPTANLQQPLATNSPTPIPTPVPSPSVVAESGKWAYIPVDNDSLLKEYGKIFGNVGTCLTYSGVFDKKELQDKETMDFVRENYNSFTLENEMKPSYLLADSEASFFDPPFNELMSRSEAEAQGYTIPEGYTESKVPKINFDRMDKILKIASDNGIRMRGHTLIWHKQTPMAFFKENYNADGAFVSPEVMDQRVIYFVTNVMKHIYSGEYKDVVYVWDICNEYFHMSDQDRTGDNWSRVYDVGSTSNPTTEPSFVKLAFKTAYDVLSEYGMADKVPLMYNDYNTSQVKDKIISLFNYLNTQDSINVNGEKICAGVGMQCHLDVKWPSVSEQLGTVKSFIDAGCEVQITELDIINGLDSSEEKRCDYWYDFMKGLVDFRKDGAAITGVTFWGLSDSVSWRYGQKALLYGESIKDPHKALYAVYSAAQTWGN